MFSCQCKPYERSPALHCKRSRIMQIEKEALGSSLGAQWKFECRINTRRKVSTTVQSVCPPGVQEGPQWEVQNTPYHQQRCHRGVSQRAVIVPVALWEECESALCEGWNMSSMFTTLSVCPADKHPSRPKRDATCIIRVSCTETYI